MFAFRLCCAALLIPMSGCRVTDLPLWGPITAPSPEACEITRLRDIDYHPGPHADKVRHRLDVYLPKGKKDYPVVVLVHGGAWMVGDNRCCGLYSTVGEFLASQGIGAVLPNYRLSPKVKHPEHVRDVARAVAWTKNHIGEHGGDPHQLFVMGHSAGGHLVALLASDPRYLKAEGLTSADIKGVIGVSGVYSIPPGKTDVELGGSTPMSIRFDEMSPIRGEGPVRGPHVRERPGVAVRVNVFGPAFGDNAKERADASPITHVRPGLPPFLLLSADRDLPLLPAMAKEMHEKLLECGCSSQLITIERRNHNSILFKAIEPNDAAARAIVEFMRTQTGIAHGYKRFSEGNQID